jgi:nucleoside-specific outer membrane channel protein Tsx
MNRPGFKFKPRQVNDSSQSNQIMDHLVSHTALVLRLIHRLQWNEVEEDAYQTTFCHPPPFSRLEGLRKIYHSFKCWSQSIQLTRVHIGYVMATWIQSGHCTYERHISNTKYNELITNERHISSSYWHSCMCHLRYYAFFCLQSLCTGQMKSYHHETKHHTPTSRYGT